ncbi:hypothetical protein N7493_006749 [Penicillium malachiteum]|uniref:Glycosyltransferase family 28 N-terminal domain-containing protein n=1 Tax=Penicillium malachiteum TaxID=1324776 RepID=A0AAD6HJA4_9EURO|nr:hypothetical protein N7493_006749 [Penicillium malachiteum]
MLGFIYPKHGRLRELMFGIYLMVIVGSRGDVQPFIALGSASKQYGHRVRIATHDTFADFVRESGLEFYPFGGDPAEMMAYMVKNPGLIPQMKTLREGEVKKKQVMVAQILDGCWCSCIEDDPLTNEPFVADAIIANPPSFAHIHCAQALAQHLWILGQQIGYHMEWWSGLLGKGELGFLIKPCSCKMTFWLGGVINELRSTINLDPIPHMEDPSLVEVLNIPFTYCWSPALIPKPQDWAAHIEKFLQAVAPPVYIGFGNIVVANPQKLINTALLTVKRAGVRAIVSKGWSRIEGAPDPSIYYIGDCPDEWLFQHISAVVHHGGAGTTASGLLNSQPSVIVPFFGDQPFWGNMIARAGAGPRPIPYASLTVQNLAAAIEFSPTKEVKTVAEAISQKMRVETGVRAAVNSFHRHLLLDQMRCDIMAGQPAVLKYTKGKRPLNISTAAALIMIERGSVDARHFQWYVNKLLRAQDLTCFNLPVRFSTHHKNNTPVLGRPYHQRPPSAHHNLVLKHQQTPQHNKALANLQEVTLKVVVDIPHAAAEGFRQVPRLYGDKPKEYESVKDWKSGAIFGGKNFVDGMSEGFSGLITQPIKGGKEEGALGAVKGFAKGNIGLATKVPSAGIGLVAYPLHGISKNIDAALRSNSQKAIVNARLRQGRRHLLPLEEQDGILRSTKWLVS